MEVEGTEIHAKPRKVQFSLKSQYKEPTLTISLEGVELFKVEIDATAQRSISGADDILSFQVALSDTTGGEVQKLIKQVHIPTFIAESKAAKAAEAKPESPTQAGA